MIKRILIFLTVAVVGSIFTQHNACLYQEPIATIVKAESGHQNTETDQFRNRDYSQSQQLWLKVLNGHYKNKIFLTKNTFSGSNAQDLKYKVGQQVFVHIQGNKHNQRLLIIDLKRDTISFLVIWLVVFCLFATMRGSGGRSLLSVIVNALLFLLAIKIDIWTDADNALFLYCMMSVLFLVTTALLIYGKSAKALSVFISATIAIFTALFLALLVLRVTHGRGLKFETMNYVTQMRMPLYLAETVVGVLGAVIDVSGDITVSLFAMKSNKTQLTYQQLFRAGCQIGCSVMGPLTNILFLIFTASTLPLMILFLRNGNNLGYSISMIMSLGIFQSLTSGVGIALSVPISSLVSGWLLKKVIG
uniref:YibE/F family protein n=1 Tax=Lentilactobacillus hilgardii TaxID=1588 RepID=UPI00403F0EC5